MYFRTIIIRRSKSMATIKANGGAASVWQHSKGLRVVLCRNGKVLTGIGPGAYHHAQTDRFVGLVGKPLEELSSQNSGADTVQIRIGNVRRLSEGWRWPVGLQFDQLWLK